MRQQSAEMNVKSNLESMVGSDEANEILKLPAGSNIEQEILDITKNKSFVCHCVRWQRAQAVKYLNGLTDLTKIGDSVAEQLSKAVVQGRASECSRISQINSRGCL